MEGPTSNSIRTANLYLMGSKKKKGIINNKMVWWGRGGVGVDKHYQNRLYNFTEN